MASFNNADHAIQYNNIGVQLMNRGQSIKAIPFFQKALDHLKAELDSQQPLLESRHGTKTLAFRMSNLETTNLLLEQETFIFKSPIIVSPVATMGKSNDRHSLESLVRFSFSLLYNLAVAMHFGGLGSQNMQVAERRIKKSLVFYELAYSMMQEEQIDGLTETMAIINNIAQVQSVVGNVGKANQCYEKLLSIMVCVIDCGQQSSVHQFKRLYENALTVLMPHAPVAQAA